MIKRKKKKDEAEVQVENQDDVQPGTQAEDQLVDQTESAVEAELSDESLPAEVVQKPVDDLAEAELETQPHPG